MVSGFCQHCKQNVLLVRDEFDVCLAIILLIFTAGIGLIIYLVIYYSKPEDRCVHCGNKIAFIDSSQYSQQESQSQNYSQTAQTQPLQTETSIENRPIFCSFCGEKISSDVIYCPNCGSKT